MKEIILPILLAILSALMVLSVAFMIFTSLPVKFFETIATKIQYELVHRGDGMIQVKRVCYLWRIPIYHQWHVSGICSLYESISEFKTEAEANAAIQRMEKQLQDEANKKVVQKVVPVSPVTFSVSATKRDKTRKPQKKNQSQIGKTKVTWRDINDC